MMRRILPGTLAGLAGLLLFAASLKSSEGQAMLFVYRLHKFSGANFSPSIFIDGREIARAGDGQFFSIAISQGRHSIRSTDANSVVDINAEPGKMYFIRSKISEGSIRGHGQVLLATADEAVRDLPRTKPLKRGLVKPGAIALGGIRTQWPPEKAENAEQAAGAVNPDDSAVTITSVPPGAEIEIDNAFAGNTPSTIRLRSGQHALVVRKEGYAPWERKLAVTGGSAVAVQAELSR